MWKPIINKLTTSIISSSDRITYTNITLCESITPHTISGTHRMLPTYQCLTVVMVLTHENGQDPNIVHPFACARVLGVYHTNCVYISPRMDGYQSHQMEFLWIRWYCQMQSVGAERGPCWLDCKCFPPLMEDDMFSFIDPANIFRSCYIVTMFVSGRYTLVTKVYHYVPEILQTGHVLC